MLKKILKKTACYWFILLFPFLIRCTEPSVIGLDVQPPSDQLNVLYTDTFSVEAYTVSEDSVRSDRTTFFLAGSMNDPVFGFSRASFCTQLNLPSSNIVFPDEAMVDSLVLTLVLKGYYGYSKYASKLTLNVYEVADMLYPDSIYYSNKQIQKKRFLGTKSFVPNLDDSVSVDGEKIPPSVRIRLDNNLAKQFIEDASYGFLVNNTAFTDYFRGIIVEAVPVTIGGTIYYFDLISAASNLTMYYHTPEESSKFTFLINDKCARFNIYDNDYSSADSDLKNQLSSPQQATEKIYVQSRGGIKVNIRFPSIRNLIDPYPVIINKAELVFTVDETDFSNNIFPIPAKLTLVKYQKDTTYTFIADQFDSTFGGTYNSSKKEFRFNISKHIQSLLLEGYEDYGIALIISGASTRGDRVVLNGMLSGDLKPKLCISYTVIN